MSQQNFFVCGVHQSFFSPNVEGVVVDQVYLRCSICRSIPEIFAIKVESCQKSGRNFDVLLALPNFGGGPFKSCRPTRVITPASRHVVWRSFVKILPPYCSPEVILIR